MKIFRREGRMVEKVDFLLEELDMDVFDLMHKHYNDGDKRQELLLKNIYSMLQDIEELFEMYKEEEKD